MFIFSPAFCISDTYVTLGDVSRTMLSGVFAHFAFRNSTCLWMVEHVSLMFEQVSRCRAGVGPHFLHFSCCLVPVTQWAHLFCPPKKSRIHQGVSLFVVAATDKTVDRMEDVLVVRQLLCRVCVGFVTVFVRFLNVFSGIETRQVSPGFWPPRRRCHERTRWV
jgi:hypothetical protein